jgi:hypothetical protein
MAALGCRVQDCRVARLLILLTIPAPLSAERAEAWLHDAVAGLSAHEEVERAVLSRLLPGSRRFPRNWDRLIELHLCGGINAGAWVDTGACGEWLADLRSLRLHPQLLLADATIVIGDA